MMTDELLQKAQALYSRNGKNQFLFVYADGRKERQRLGRTAEGKMLIINKGQQCRGRYLTGEEGLIDIVPITEAPKSKQWLNSINKAIKILEGSGLWKDVLSDLRIAREVGHDKLQEAYDVATNQKYSEDYEQNKKEQNKKVAEIHPRLMDGEHYKTSILWYMAHPLKIKKMNFGIRTPEILADINNAIKKGQKISTSGRSSYDVSFNYDPKENKAWYSEEFKKCGNGHYYLAISATHAVFYEDD